MNSYHCDLTIILKFSLIFFKEAMQLNFVAMHNKKSKLIGEGMMNQSSAVNKSVRLTLVE